MSNFSNPVKVRFGVGEFDRLKEALGGRSFILITSPSIVKNELVKNFIKTAKPIAVFDKVSPNPTVASILAMHAFLKKFEAAVIVGIGGGSVLDSAKAIAALHAPEFTTDKLITHLKTGSAIERPFRPSTLICIPTTSGTGSEVTRWGTLWDEKTGAKYSISDMALYPELAIIDPRLTLTLPASTTVATALDSLSHAMESVWNRKHNETSDKYAARAIELIFDALPKALENPQNLDARTALAEASLKAGLASSNTQTAIAHSISYPLTSQLGIEHGFACSFTLPEILQINGQEFPDRIKVILTALKADSLDQGSKKLYEFYKHIHVYEHMKRSAKTLDLVSFKAEFINPARAGNNLVSVDQKKARELVIRAIGKLK